VVGVLAVAGGALCTAAAASFADLLVVAGDSPERDL
jgi:hypothetical protein